MKKKAHNIILKTIGKATKLSGNLQILMYHRIQSTPISKPYLPIPYFYDQIMYLHDSGYKTYRLSDLVSNWDQIINTPKSIILTFDDVWSSQVDVVLPLLKDVGFFGTFFVPTAHIKDERQKPKFSDLQRFDDILCSWDDVRKLEEEGMELGGHTHSHYMLTSLTLDEVENELISSNAILKSKLKNPVVSFSYPFGKRNTYNQQIIDLVKYYGYKIGCSTIWGRPNFKSNKLLLPRIGINGDDNLDNFVKKLEGLYDYKRWIHKYL